MGSFPGHFFKRILGRLFAKDTPPVEIANQPWKFEQDSSAMSAPELETSGLREKPTSINFPVLPDGSTPVQMGSGVITIAPMTIIMLM